MLWYCRYTWNPQTTREQVAERVVAQDAAGTNMPDKIKGWYDLAGGGAGFLLIESDNPQDLTTILQPYLDLISVDVHAVIENDYDATIERLKNV